MSEVRHASACRWARLTLYLPYPAWLEAEDHPWTCLREAEPRPFEAAEHCETCPHWQSRRLSTDSPQPA